MAGERDPMRWVWRGITGLTLLLGWFFILWQNRFHVDAPVVVVGLGFLAVVLTVTNLWRVGAAAVAPEDTSPEAWSRPLGERGELEREKRTLLRSIKEAEFDQAMGKLSKSDAEELIRMYRARAIELIKELDRLDAGHAETPRQAIERELAARVAIEEEKAKARKGKKGGKAKGKAPDAATVKASAQTTDTEAEAATDDTPADDATQADAADATAAADAKAAAGAKAVEDVKTTDAKPAADAKAAAGAKAVEDVKTTDAKPAADAKAAAGAKAVEDVKTTDAKPAEDAQEVSS